MEVQWRSNTNRFRARTQQTLVDFLNVELNLGRTFTQSALLAEGVRLAVFVAIALTAMQSTPAWAQEAGDIGTGMVRSEDGAPLRLVWVQELGPRLGRLTESDGRFTFTAGKPVSLLLYKDGFRPQVIAVSGSEERSGLSVVLAADPKPNLVLRSCKGGTALIPEIEPAGMGGVRLRRGGDADFSSYTATYMYGGSEWNFSSMTGAHVDGIAPGPEWVAGLSSFTVRSLKCARAYWFDLRGVTADGLESRWLGYIGFVEYSKVPPAVARMFDKAIDTGAAARH